MKLGLRQYKNATLRIALPDVPDDMREGMREIFDVLSNDRRKGQMTTLMWDVCREADEALKVLILQPKAFDEGLDDARLRRFYEKFNFVQIQDNPPLMARPPDLKKVIH